MGSSRTTGILKLRRRMLEEALGLQPGEIDRLRAENTSLLEKLKFESDCLEASQRNGRTQFEEKERLKAENARQAETVASLQEDKRLLCLNVDSLVSAKATLQTSYDELWEGYHDQAETIAKLREQIEAWKAYADSKRVGRPVDDVPFG